MLDRTNKNYTAWFIGNTAGAFGRAVSILPLILLAYATTKSATTAGFLGTLEMLIAVVLTPAGGVIVDRMDRRTAIRIRCAVAIVTWAAMTAILLAHIENFAILVVVAVVTSANSGLLGGASEAALRAIVPKKEYSSAVAANEGRDGVMSLIGSPLAGLLYAISRALPAALVTISFVGELLSLRFITTDLAGHLTKPRLSGKSALREELAEPARWLNGRTDILRVLGLLPFLNLCIVCVFYHFQLRLVADHTGSFAVGALDLGVAIGAIVGSALAAVSVKRVKAGSSVVFSLFWLALSMIPAIAFPHYWGMFTSEACIGVALPLTNAPLLGFIFAECPDEIQGRVHSLVLVISSSAACLAPLMGGALVSNPDERSSAILLGCCILLLAIIASLSRVIRNLEVTDDETGPAVAQGV